MYWTQIFFKLYFKMILDSPGDVKIAEFLYILPLAFPSGNILHN